MLDTQTGEVIRTFSGHNDYITFVCFSPDGRRVLTSGQDETARLWDRETGRELLTLTGDIKVATFLPDGHRILTGGRVSFKVWSLATPGQVADWESQSEADAARLAPRVAELEARNVEQRRLIASWDNAREAFDDKVAEAVKKAGPTPHAIVGALTQPWPAADPKVIRDWLVLWPPMDHGDSRAKWAVMQDRLPAEQWASAQEGKRVQVGSEESTWTAVHLEEDANFLDLMYLLSRDGPADTSRKLTYATTSIVSEREQKNLVMRVHFNWAARLYLNGREIYRKFNEADYQYADIPGVELRQGANQIVLQVASGWMGTWEAAVLLMDADGNPLEGIQVVLPTKTAD